MNEAAIAASITRIVTTIAKENQQVLSMVKAIVESLEHETNSDFEQVFGSVGVEVQLRDGKITHTHLTKKITKQVRDN